MHLSEITTPLETTTPYVPGYYPLCHSRAPADCSTKAQTHADADLTYDEVAEIKTTLCCSGDRELTPQEVFDQLKAAMPSHEGYFSEKRRLLLLGAVWVVKSGEYKKILQRDETPLFQNADQFYESLQLGSRQAVSKSLQAERCFRLLPPELREKVDGPGCLEPLFPLTTATPEKLERAFTALKALGGELSKAAASAAMELSIGPAEPNLKEVMTNKVGIRKNDAALKSLSTLLSRVPEKAVRSHALAKQLIESLKAEKPILVPGLTTPPQAVADPKPKAVQTAVQSGYDTFPTSRAKIEITPISVTVRLKGSGHGTNLIMGLIDNKSFRFKHMVVETRNEADSESGKTRWVSDLSETSVAGKMLRAALGALKDATAISRPQRPPPLSEVEPDLYRDHTRRTDRNVNRPFSPNPTTTP